MTPCVPFVALVAALLGPNAPLGFAPPTPQVTMPPAVPPALTPAPTSLPAPPSAVLPRAKEWMRRVQTGRIDRSQLTPATNTALTPRIAERLKAAYGRLGAPVAFTFVNERDLGAGNTAYNYRVRFKHAILIEKVVIDGNGKISGLSFTPAS